MDPPASKVSLTSGMIVIKEEKLDSQSMTARRKNINHENSWVQMNHNRLDQNTPLSTLKQIMKTSPLKMINISSMKQKRAEYSERKIEHHAIKPYY